MEQKEKKWIIGTLITIIGIIISSLPIFYSLGEGNGRSSVERECAKLERECAKLEAIIETLRDSIEILKVREVIVIENVTNNVNYADSIFKKQIEVLIKQGNNLLIDYKEQTDMTYKFDTWKNNVIGILNNKDKEIANKTDNIERKYSPGDYYSQIRDIIILLNNYLN